MDQRSRQRAVRSCGTFILALAIAGCGGGNTAGGDGAAPRDGAPGAMDSLQRDAHAIADSAVSNDAGAIDMSAAIDGSGGDGAVTQGGCKLQPTSLTLAPANLMASVTLGQSFTQPYVVTAQYANAPATDVTAQTFLSSSDPTLGDFTGATFDWAGAHGGSATISARQCGVTASTTITLALSAPVAGDPNVNLATAMTEFGPNAPTSTNTQCAPTLVYPPDGVLLPPNTNVIEVHFLEGTNNSLFEISFENAVTDVRVYTTCKGTTAAQGMPLNGGCVFELSQAEWNYVAQTNRNGAPVTVKVRAVGCDGQNVASSATRNISFAQQDVVGTLYYWASMRISNNTVNSGGIFDYDFGVRGQMPNPVLTPSSPSNPSALCIGCHDISRDGRQMVFDFDDNDDDDEYNDVRTDVFDIVNQKPAQPIVKNGMNVFPPGYHTWNRETTEFLLSDGPGNKSTPAGAFRQVGPAGTTLGYAQAGTLRGTTPDWAPDDSAVVFAVPTGYFAPNANMSMTTGPDLWFQSASLYTAPWNSVTKTLGAPTALISASGTNNYYYPSYSPEGSFIAFNHAASGPNFHNPLARVQLVAAGQANPTPVDLAKLNDSGSLTNSWARWSPFVQTYQGGQLLWITFSSTRSYGLRIINDSSKQNCYPTESPQGYPVFSQATNCTRTQIWMAAIKLDANGVIHGQDPSWPAFWLPFQDLLTNNHLAQWAQQSWSGPCAQNADCAMGQCCEMGGCTACPAPPPPPAATCAIDANCAPGQCCRSGACAACPVPDGGSPATDLGASGDGAVMSSPDAGPSGCNTCLDCSGQACIGGKCSACTTSDQCCAPLVCDNGQCVMGIM